MLDQMDHRSHPATLPMLLSSRWEEESGILYESGGRACQREKEWMLEVMCAHTQVGSTKMILLKLFYDFSGAPQTTGICVHSLKHKNHVADTLQKRGSEAQILINHYNFYNVSPQNYNHIIGHLSVQSCVSFFVIISYTQIINVYALGHYFCGASSFWISDFSFSF